MLGNSRKSIKALTGHPSKSVTHRGRLTLLSLTSINLKKKNYKLKNKTHPTNNKNEDETQKEFDSKALQLRHILPKSRSTESTGHLFWSEGFKES